MLNRVYKIFSMIIVTIMFFSCFSLKAFAENKTTHTYELYQIFTGTISSDGVLSDVEWGKNANKPQSGEPADGKVSDTVLKELEKVTQSSDSEKLNIIKNYVNFGSAPYKGEQEQPAKDPKSNKYTYTNIEPGYYIIKDKDNTQSGENGIYTLYVVQASGSSLVFEPKSSIPTVDKKIDDNVLTDSNGVSIGDDVNYMITGTVPSHIADYATYYYKFTDTLSKGLTYEAGSLKVYLKNGDSQEDVTQYFYVHTSDYNKENGTTITVAIQDLKSLANIVKDDPKYTVNAATKIFITYTATLNENAMIKDPNINEVYLTYSNDPNNSGNPSVDTPPTPSVEPKPDVPVGETVKAKTETYTTALVVTKINEEKEKLQGAVFTLTGNGVKQVLVTEQVFEKNEMGTYYKLTDGTYTETVPTIETSGNYESTETKYIKTTKVTLKGENQSETKVQGEVDENGVVIFTGLGAGDYILTETKAPDGYNKMEPINFTINFDSITKTFTSTYKEFTNGVDDGKLYASIVNYPGSKLPSTGGVGTTIFYIVGSILSIGAIILLIVKKRMINEEI